ncbi:MAG: hypothetical protein MZV65_32135 [Chromatiales bacterium]|nr:hypothetical protein [Chromatiales bacterium]
MQHALHQGDSQHAAYPARNPAQERQQHQQQDGEAQAGEQEWLELSDARLAGDEVEGPGGVGQQRQQQIATSCRAGVAVEQFSGVFSLRVLSIPFVVVCLYSNA